MELMVIIAAVLLLLGVAVSTAASRSGRLGNDAPALLRLSHLRSSSGMPFFPTDHAMWDLSGELDDVSDGSRRSSGAGR